MILINSLRGWGLIGLISMLVNETLYLLFNGLRTYRNIGYKGKALVNTDNYNIPTPAIYLNKLKKIFENYQDFTFVDVGSGKGRVLKAAVELNFARIISIEKSNKLNEELKKTFKQKITYYEEDARDFLLTESENAIFYFFESFDENHFVSLIKKQIKQISFKSLFVVLVYSRSKTELENYLEYFEIFHNFEFSKKRKMIILKKK